MLKKLTNSNLNGEVKERSAEPIKCWTECKTACYDHGGPDYLVDDLHRLFYYY